MVNWNLLGTFKRFFTESIPKTFNKLKSGISEGLQKSGRAVSGISHALGSGYGLVKNIPFVKSLLGALPIEKGISAIDSSGNLLRALGGGDFGEAVGQGANIVSNLGGFGNMYGASEPLNEHQKNLVSEFQNRLEPITK